MSEVKTNPTPTEAQVTAQTQASGVPAGQNTNDNEADANGKKQETTTKVVREAKRVVIPADFDFAVDPEPRPSIDPMNPPAAQQQQNQQSQNPVNALADGIEIEFRGQKQKIGLDEARTMIQQFKSVSAMSPVVGLANQIADTLGIKDPRQVAELIKEAVTSYAKNGNGQPGQPPAGDPAQPGTAAQAAAAAGVQPQAVPPEIGPEVDAAVDAFFSQNGLTPTPEVREGMRNILAYGAHIQTIAKSFPQLVADVDVFKRSAEVNSRRALSDAVNARAAKVAAELGIDTAEEVQGFQGWVNEVATTFPGFKNSIATNPEAMEKAIRQYHIFSVGQRTLTKQTETRQNVQADLGRAGGDATGGRAADPSAPAAKPDEQKAFNDDMMGRM